MTEEILSHLAELAGEHARNVLVELQQNLMPSWVLIDKSGAFHIEATPWKNQVEKDLARVFMRQQMRQLGVRAYSLVVEAWAAVAPEGWKPGDPHLPSSQHPDRREVVIAFATDGESIQWRQWATRRNHLEQVVALEKTDFDGSKTSSWMTNLLSKPII